MPNVGGRTYREQPFQRTSDMTQHFAQGTSEEGGP